MCTKAQQARIVEYNKASTNPWMCLLMVLRKHVHAFAKWSENISHTIIPSNVGLITEKVRKSQIPSYRPDVDSIEKKIGGKNSPFP